MSNATPNATPSDAQIVMQLYDLRREEIMRKARKFVLMQFWPASFEEFQKVLQASSTDENAYLRQVTSFWDMAASLPLRGAVNKDLFFDWSAEMFFLFAKLKPFLAEWRKTSPTALGRIEALIESSDRAKETIALFDQRVKSMAAARAGK
jgi:hypothetical protein